MQRFDCGRFFSLMGAGKKGRSAAGDLTAFLGLLRQREKLLKTAEGEQVGL